MSQCMILNFTRILIDCLPDLLACYSKFITFGCRLTFLLVRQSRQQWLHAPSPHWGCTEDALSTTLDNSGDLLIVNWGKEERHSIRPTHSDTLTLCFKSCMLMSVNGAHR